MNTFATKRDAIKYYDEYYVSIMCERKLKSGAKYMFGFFYDTRLMSKESANEHKDSIKNMHISYLLI